MCDDSFQGFLCPYLSLSFFSDIKREWKEKEFKLKDESPRLESFFFF